MITTNDDQHRHATLPRGKTAKTAVVIPTHNRPVLLSRCLAAISRQTCPCDTVYVVDNASRDDPEATIRELLPGSQYLRMATNVGGAGAFVAGIRAALAAGHDWVWLMDDDAVPRDDVLARLLNHAPGWDIVVPAQRDDTGKLYGAGRWRCGVESLKITAVGAYPIELFAFVGPLIRSTVFERIGLPREDYFLWFDDIEFSRRAARAGVKTALIADAIVEHRMGDNVSKTFLGVTVEGPRYTPVKLYYGTRNYLYTITRPRFEPGALYTFVRKQSRTLIHHLLIDPHNAVQYIGMMGKGLVDGVLGRLGSREHSRPNNQ